ncbi:WG repeat-containing protein [Aureibaculum algae]|uniref:WG repeat-containing protein n=1 Tax=Aureibaculum algae TaxID=2584122 RepID=A0A5B7TUJ3_9FLAO|nr:WG repeat-containing protein [Aureibaculum algae]QCX38991.1 WG repeat-containing protein [Aureibaculum algae]
MKSIVSLALLLFFQCTYSQVEEPLIPFKNKGSWGFSDVNREIIIEAQYDTVHFFDRNNLSKVYKNKVFGFINKNGKNIVPIALSNAKLIADSLYIVEKNMKYGIIDKNGNNLLDTDFQHIEYINTGFFIVKKKDLYGVYNVANSIQNPFLEISYDNIEYQDYQRRFICQKNSDVYIYDRSGELLEKRKMDDENNGFDIDLPFTVARKNEYPKFETIHKKKLKGLIITAKRTRGSSYLGIVTNTIEAKYDSINPKHWDIDCFVVKRKNKWGAINLKGETLLENKYEDIDVASIYLRTLKVQPYRHLYIVKKDDKWGLVMSKSTGNYVKLKNNVVIPFEYDAIYKNVEEPFYIVKANNKYGVFLNSGYQVKQITETKYAKIDLMHETVDGFKLVKVVDTNGDVFFVGENGAEFFQN